MMDIKNIIDTLSYFISRRGIYICSEGDVRILAAAIDYVGYAAKIRDTRDKCVFVPVKGDGFIKKATAKEIIRGLSVGKRRKKCLIANDYGKFIAAGDCRSFKPVDRRHAISLGRVTYPVMMAVLHHLDASGEVPPVAVSAYARGAIQIPGILGMDRHFFIFNILCKNLHKNDMYIIGGGC